MLSWSACLLSYPQNLDCSTRLATGVEMMNGAASSSTRSVLLSGGLHCGGDVTEGAAVLAKASLPSPSCAALLEVEGGHFSGGWCSNRRKVQGGCSWGVCANPWLPITPASMTMRIWFGFACDAFDSVSISQACTLNLVAAPSPPPLPPTLAPVFPSSFVSSKPAPPLSPPPSVPPPTAPPPLEQFAPLDSGAAGEALRQPRQWRSEGGSLRVALELGLLRYRLPGGLSLQMASYNGSLPAPTLRVRAGHRLTFELRNALLADDTNLHMHGLHVRPDEDDTFASVPPGGGQKTYTYHIPSDHHGGTFWYESPPRPDVTLCCH